VRIYVAIGLVIVLTQLQFILAATTTTTTTTATTSTTGTTNLTTATTTAAATFAATTTNNRYCWKVGDEGAIDLHDYEVVNGTLSECIQECTSRDYCRSFDFHDIGSGSTCHLSNVTKNDVPSDYVWMYYFDYYECSLPSGGYTTTVAPTTTTTGACSSSPPFTISTTTDCTNAGHSPWIYSTTPGAGYSAFNVMDGHSDQRTIDNSDCYVEFEIELVDGSRWCGGTIQIETTISSESGYDYGYVYSDGMQKSKHSGVLTDVISILPPDSGDIRRIKFRYTKDNSADRGDDKFSFRWWFQGDYATTTVAATTAYATTTVAATTAYATTTVAATTAYATTAVGTVCENIYVGKSSNNIKYVDLPRTDSTWTCSNEPQNRQESDWYDEFAVSTDGLLNELTVERTDSTSGGWGQSLELRCCYVGGPIYATTSDPLQIPPFDIRDRVNYCDKCASTSNRWTYSGNGFNAESPMIGQSNMHKGQCGRSYGTMHSDICTIEFEITRRTNFGPGPWYGDIQLWTTISSEMGGDKGYVYSDGVLLGEKDGVSGSGTERHVIGVPHGAETRTLTFAYSKDSGSSSGDDKFSFQLLFQGGYGFTTTAAASTAAAVTKLLPATDYFQVTQETKASCLYDIPISGDRGPYTVQDPVTGYIQTGNSDDCWIEFQIRPKSVAATTAPAAVAGAGANLPPNTGYGSADFGYDIKIETTISSEACCDKGYIFSNGVEKLKTSGTETKTVVIPKEEITFEGGYTALKFKYSKDGADSRGDDKFSFKWWFEDSQASSATTKTTSVTADAFVDLSYTGMVNTGGYTKDDYCYMIYDTSGGPGKILAEAGKSGIEKLAGSGSIVNFRQRCLNWRIRSRSLLKEEQQQRQQLHASANIDGNKDIATNTTVTFDEERFVEQRVEKYDTQQNQDNENRTMYRSSTRSLTHDETNLNVDVNYTISIGTSWESAERMKSWDRNTLVAELSAAYVNEVRADRSYKLAGNSEWSEKMPYYKDDFNVVNGASATTSTYAPSRTKSESSSSSSSSSSSKLSGGAIAGIVIGVLVFCGVCVAGIVILIKSQGASSKQGPATSGPGPTPPVVAYDVAPQASKSQTGGIMGGQTGGIMLGIAAQGPPKFGGTGINPGNNPVTLSGWNFGGGGVNNPMSGFDPAMGVMGGAAPGNTMGSVYSMFAVGNRIIMSPGSGIYRGTRAGGTGMDFEIIMGGDSGVVTHVGDGSGMTLKKIRAESGMMENFYGVTFDKGGGCYINPVWESDMQSGDVFKGIGGETPGMMGGETPAGDDFYAQFMARNQA